MSDLSDFTKLVLARLETNPDEFEPNGRWDNLVRGLEEYARGDTEGRYVKTLWPLEHQEIEVMLAKYRRVYLDRLHKDMLKNIVSGNDLNRAQYKYDSDVKIAPLTGSVLRADVAPSVWAGAVPKMEGAQIDPNTLTYKAANRYSLNSTQLAVAKKLGIDPGEYAKRIGATEL